MELSLEHPELGGDKIGPLVRKGGKQISSKRVREVRREECLQVPPPRKKQSSRRGKSTGEPPTKAERRDHTRRGGSMRILSLVDEYTRARPTSSTSSAP